MARCAPVEVERAIRRNASATRMMTGAIASAISASFQFR